MLFAQVDDLSTYPQWLDLVCRAEREPGGTGSDAYQPQSSDIAWSVDLRARLGPLARSKRLRMIRTLRDPVGHRARFERRELDGRRHSPWVLEVEVGSRDDGSVLSMRLHYGGSLWTGGLMERALTEQIVSGRQRLLELVATTH